MVSALLRRKFGIGIFGDEVAEGRLLSLEFARRVPRFDPVGDAIFDSLRVSIQPKHDDSGEEKNEAGKERIAAYRHCREAGFRGRRWVRE